MKPGTAGHFAMGLVEIYAKFNIDRGSADVFASQAQAIVATTCKRCPDTLRCDWFFNEKQNEGIAMMVHRNDAALQQHFDAAVLLEVAKQKDTGTSRYDWFYDDANLIAVAADTYDDPASMYSHMRNFHEAHNKLLHHSTW